MYYYNGAGRCYLMPELPLEPPIPRTNRPDEDEPTLYFDMTREEDEESDYE